MLLSSLSNRPLNLDDAGKLRLLLEAQFYLTAARKRDERVASRDFWLEVTVIVLIFVEIIISVAGIRIEILEGNQVG